MFLNTASCHNNLLIRPFSNQDSPMFGTCLFVFTGKPTFDFNFYVSGSPDALPSMGF